VDKRVTEALMRLVTTVEKLPQTEAYGTIKMLI
jgi:hypothetical protein